MEVNYKPFSNIIFVSIKDKTQMRLIIKKKCKENMQQNCNKAVQQTSQTPGTSNDTTLCNLGNQSDDSFRNIIIKGTKQIRASIEIRSTKQTKENQIPMLFTNDECKYRNERGVQDKKNIKENKIKAQKTLQLSINPVGPIGAPNKNNKHPPFKLNFQTPKSRSNSVTHKSVRNSFGNRLFAQSKNKMGFFSRQNSLGKSSCGTPLNEAGINFNKTETLNTYKKRSITNAKLRQETLSVIQKAQNSNGNATEQQKIKVYVRVKPVANYQNDECVFHMNQTTIKISDRIFAFDQVFPGCSTQSQVFQKVGTPVIQSLFQGFNGTIFAYGQTGSGKTYTIFGGQDLQNQGIISKSISEIYKKSRLVNKKIECMKCSMLQIYKESLIDMFDSKKQLKLKESKNGIFIDGISQRFIQSQLDFITMIKTAQKSRRVACTKINQKSSRSHTILTILIRFQDYECKLCLIDLAGSQKISKSGVSGVTLQQTKKINYSLSCLGNVINALVTRKKSNHIPFRDSKLTRILKDSLSGKFKTSLIVNCSSQQSAVDQTISSLKFAERAKRVKINPKNVQKKDNHQSIQYLHNVIKKLTSDLNLTKRQLIKYKSICNSINNSNQGSNESLCGLKINLEAQSVEFDSILPESCGQIPSERARVDQNMKQYQQSLMNKSKKMQASFLHNNLSSLNVSNSNANPMSGVCSPSLSSLSFRELNSSRIQSSFTLSLCKEQENIDSFKTRHQNIK